MSLAAHKSAPQPRHDLWDPTLQQIVRFAVAEQSASGAQGLDIPLKEFLLLSEVAGSAALRVRPPTLASPPQAPRTQQEQRPDGIATRLLIVSRCDLPGASPRKACTSSHALTGASYEREQRRKGGYQWRGKWHARSVRGRFKAALHVSTCISDQSQMQP